MYFAIIQNKMCRILFNVKFLVAKTKKVPFSFKLQVGLSKYNKLYHKNISRSFPDGTLIIKEKLILLIICIFFHFQDLLYPKDYLIITFIS